MSAKLTGTTIALLTLTTIASAQEVAPPLEPAQANRARLAWSAFECATFAEVAGDKDAQMRLFQMGYEIGKAFLDQFTEDTTPGEDAMQEMKGAPIGFSFRLGGPSNDFRLGRIYEGAADAANEKISERDARGFPLDPADYVSDPDLQTSIARTKFLTENCALLR